MALEYAFLCYETGEPVAARRIFERLRKAGDAVAAEAFENVDRPLREGIARWQEAVAQSPDNFSAHEELAKLAEQRDQLELSAQHFEAAWKLRPGRRDLLLDLGRVWKGLGRAEDAMAALPYDPSPRRRSVRHHIQPSAADSRTSEPIVRDHAIEPPRANYPFL